MKAITIYQPWASLIAAGAKRFETRSWATRYRGPIAIHTGKTPVPPDFGFVTRIPESKIADALGIHRPYDTENDRDFWRRCIDDEFLGAVVATAELAGCHRIVRYGGRGMTSRDPGWIEGDDWIYEPTEQELLFGDWTPGRYAWELTNVKPLPEPIPAKGKQGLWDFDDGTLKERI